MESRSAVHPGKSPNAYTPYEAALSEDPWPTMRIVVARRSRISPATLSKAALCSRRRRRAAGCSPISARKRDPGPPGRRSGGSGSATASAEDTFPPIHEHAVDLELVREHHDVRRKAHREPPDRRQPQHASRHLGRRADRLGERGTELVQVPHGVDHRERASGERPARPARDAVADLDLEAGEAIGAVREARARDGVGDERDAPLRSPPDDAGRLRAEVDAVEDHLHDDVVACERCPGDARVAMPERAHSVEEVGHGADAGVERGVRLMRRRVRMTARDGDLVAQERLDESVGAGELRREGHEADGPRGEQPLEELHVRIPAGGGGMNPEAQGGEERSFEVHAENAGPVRARRHLAEGGEELLFGRCDERGEVGRDAGLEQGVTGASVAVGVGLEEVDAGEAVHLQVDESRNGDPPTVGRDEPVAGDPSVDKLDVASHEPAVDECGFDSEPHRSSALRMLWPARSRRVRASSGPTSARSETIAIFASPPEAASAASTSWGSAPVAARTMRRTRARSFSLVAATSTIRLPNVFPSRIIEIVESMFRTSFCAVPALRRVDPARNSGPTSTTIGISATASSSDPATETTQAVRAPAAAALSTAATTYGVRPLALTPTTTSSGRRSSAATSALPASRSSSAASCSSGEA